MREITYFNRRGAALGWWHARRSRQDHVVSDAVCAPWKLGMSQSPSAYLLGRLNGRTGGHNV
jgi:hypothetical protein